MRQIMMSMTYKTSYKDSRNIALSLSAKAASKVGKIRMKQGRPRIARFAAAAA